MTPRAPGRSEGAVGDDLRARLNLAILEWKQELDGSQLLLAGQHGFNDNVEGLARSIPAAIIPRHTGEIPKIVSIARRYRIGLYPVSGGKNYGYGTATPVEDGNVVLDLSRLNRIVEVNRKAHWVHLEAGVTQEQLHKYLVENGLNYMVPTTGVGPQGAILGNLLERGYGITPHTDHFSSLLSVTAVLPSGEIYRSPLASVALSLADNFRWGVGPYLDGLFAQGNFAVITEATVAIAPRPECIEAFFFSIDSDEAFGRVVEVVGQLRSELGSNIGGINLMNQHRMLAMMTAYPWKDVNADGVLPESIVNRLADANSVRRWSGVGAIYGTRELVRVTGRHIRQRLKPLVNRLVFMDGGKLRRLCLAADVLSWMGISKYQALAQRLQKALELMSGIPNDTALPLMYWRVRDQSQSKAGVLWYSPLVPSNPDLVAMFTSMVKERCCSSGMEPLLTLTSISERCFIATVPLLFERTDFQSRHHAHACLQLLMEEGIRMGVFPYRLSVDHMTLMRQTDPGYRSMLRQIKEAIDPYDIIAPGRYS